MTETIDTGDIARLFGVTHSYVIGRLIRARDFPGPVVVLQSGEPYKWLCSDVMAWAAAPTGYVPRAVTPTVLAEAPKVKAPTQHVKSRLTPIHNALRSKLQGAIRRSRKRGRECLIDIDTMKALHAKQNGRCAVSGVVFSLDGGVGGPFAPSLDRIDSMKGYEPGNVRLVCHAINLMMNKWGDRVYVEFLKRIKEGT